MPVEKKNLGKRSAVVAIANGWSWETPETNDHVIDNFTNASIHSDRRDKINMYLLFNSGGNNVVRGAMKIYIQC